MRKISILISLLLAVAAVAAGQQAPRQTEADAYTRYELLAPDSASFKIYYEITATTAGAKYYYNPIRAGSTASDEAVYDAMTGEPLTFAVVTAAEARQDPMMARANDSMDYIRVTLARPMPQDGQGRIRIIKTYKDVKSYFRQGDEIVFNRPLGIQRNQVVLPPGYQLTSCNVPSQVLIQPDGRIAISFMHAGSGEAPLILHARLGAAATPPRALTAQRSWEAPPSQGPTERARLSQRAQQDRDIVYFLESPETHAFNLYHDYTESDPAAHAYYNVVREGSTVSQPSAYILDTGEKLDARVMTGNAMKAAHINPGEPVGDDTQVVVIPFTPVKAGASVRLRISETYTAPASYRLEGDELVFDRSFGRPRNAVVLPAGWYVTDSAAPATVRQLPDGRIRLDFWNDRNDTLGVLIKARHVK
ncbi:MAG TPA: hypothetical protein VN709_05365 [Terriglobales bacterium]|nr:hypothetical protein [Terriglobales bacterium]